jgi:fructokinase
VVVSDAKDGLLYQEAIVLDEIKDTTGAGDAFWTGFLYSQLHEYDLATSITIAQKLAAIKLQNIGILPDNLEILELIN